MAGRPPAPRYVQLRTATRGEPDRDQGSRTITVEQDDEAIDDQTNIPDFDGVLRLRGGPTHGNRVTWQEGTVDNEFLNRKKSKICCIFHKSKPKNFEDPFADSSSSSSSDDSSSDDDSDVDSAAEGSHCSHCDECDRVDEASPANHQGSRKIAFTKGKERADPLGLEGDKKQGEQEEPQNHAGCQQSTICARHARKQKKKHDRIKPNAYEHQPRYGKAKKRRDKGSSTMTVTQDTDS